MVREKCNSVRACIMLNYHRFWVLFFILFYFFLSSPPVKSDGNIFYGSSQNMDSDSRKDLRNPFRLKQER